MSLQCPSNEGNLPQNCSKKHKKKPKFTPRQSSSGGVPTAARQEANRTACECRESAPKSKPIRNRHFCHFTQFPSAIPRLSVLAMHPDARQLDAHVRQTPTASREHRMRQLGGFARPNSGGTAGPVSGCRNPRMTIFQRTQPDSQNRVGIPRRCNCYSHVRTYRGPSTAAAAGCGLSREGSKTRNTL